MSTAKARRIVGAAEAGRGRHESGPVVRKGPPAASLLRGRVALDDGTKCVLVPADEFERLMRIAEASELESKLQDPNAEWIDFDDYKLQLAGSRIAGARKAQGLTQVQLAHKLGLPQSQLSRIERHPDRTTIRTLKKIAAALGVDVKQLVE